MQVFQPYLNDKRFLEKVDNAIIKEHYAKIVVLSWNDETPVATIQGLVTAGTVNKSGSSAIRNTCNLTLTVNEDSVTTEGDGFSQVEKYIGVDKKIFLEVGFENFTDEYKDYPILQFPLQTFVITQASFSHNVSSVTISLQLKDKMCLLNGSIAGTLPACVNFDSVNTYDANGEEITKKIPIAQIIREAVHHFGGELEERIIIEGLDTKAKSVVKNSPLPDVSGMIIPTKEEFQEQKINYKKAHQDWMLWAGTVDDLIENANNLQSSFVGKSALKLQLDDPHAGWNFGVNTIANNQIQIMNAPSIQLQDTLYYPSDLTSSLGNSICDVLDKIKNSLGNYEYFYKNDIFYFREKKNYIYTNYSTSIEVSSPLGNGEVSSFDIDQLGSVSSYLGQLNAQSEQLFDSSKIVTAFSNTPKYENIKNDFIVWGQKKVGENTYPIRYHVAIDTKPDVGNAYFVARGPSQISQSGQTNGQEINSLTSGLDDSKVRALSWQSAGSSNSATVLPATVSKSRLDAFDALEDENLMALSALPTIGEVLITYAIYPTIEGLPANTSKERQIEAYLIYRAAANDSSFSGTWQDYEKNYDWQQQYRKAEGAAVAQLYLWEPASAEEFKYERVQQEMSFIKQVVTTDYRDELQLEGLTNLADGLSDSVNYYFTELRNEWSKIYDSYHGEYLTSFKANPEQCDQFLDIIDSDDFHNISISKIGRRTKVISDNSINCIFEPIIPEIYQLNVGNEIPNWALSLYGELDILGCITYTINGEGPKQFTPPYNEVDKWVDIINSYNDASHAINITDIRYPTYIDGHTPEAARAYYSTQQLQDIEDIKRLGGAALPIPDTIAEQLEIDAAPNSALYAIRDVIMEYTTTANTITIECLPIYQLEPNTRITVKDEASGINGDQFIDTISVPLALTGNMTITASKVIEKF